MIRMRTMGMLGAALALLGSFLPWEWAGDLISYPIYGIRLFPRLNDYGGSLVVLLTVVIVILSFRPPGFLKNAQRWLLVLTVILTIIAILFTLRWLSNRIAFAFAVGAPSIGAGLISIVLGSVVLLISAFLDLRQSKNGA